MAMKRFYLKALIFLILIGLFITVMDKAGIFAYDKTNSHVINQWDSFYEFTKTNDVDVLLVGNSHLYTGINPNHLSCALGANCFILASPGTTIADSYFALKEGLTKCSPKLVVVETYGISESNVRKLTGGNLTSQFRSFSSRKNVPMKLASTPVLFSPDNYLSAWSESIQGHDLLFKDPAQVKKNLAGKNIPAKKKDLELGRFTRFTTGITEETDKEYDEKGPVVDGNEFKVNRENYEYAQKIKSLCEKKGVRLMFLTLPMYYKHVKNYSSWHTIMSRVIGDGQYYLDLQDDYDYKCFTRECFENTRSSNQHMSAQGAIVADYKLADFIVNRVKPKLENRYKSLEWRGMFYGERGYFENYPREPSDKRSLSVCENVNVGGISIMDSVFIPDSDGGQFFMRITKNTVPQLIANGLILYIYVTFKDGSIDYYKVAMRKIPGIDPLNHQVLLSGYLALTNVSSIKLMTLEINGS